MLKAFLKLKASDWAVVLTGLAVVVALEFVPQDETLSTSPIPEAPLRMLPGLPDVPQYGQQTVQIPDDLPGLSGATLTAFETKFKNAPYFAAFATNAKGAFGWTSGFSTAAAARRGALSFCTQHGPDCRIVAERVPADLQGEPPAKSLSFAQAEIYLTYAQKSHPAAFVSAADGAYGVATATTTGEAINKAYQLCEANLLKDMRLEDMGCLVLKVWD